MVEILSQAVIISSLAAGTIAGLGYGIAAVIREVSAHKVAMRLIDRGETPPPRARITIGSFLPRLGDRA